MRALLLAAIAGLSLVSTAQAQQPPVSIYAGILRPLGYCQLTVNASTQLTACPGGIPAGATIVDIIVEAQAVRYRDDGGTPTSSSGMPLAVGTEKVFVESDLSALRFIAQVAGGIINVSFY